MQFSGANEKNVPASNNFSEALVTPKTETMQRKTRSHTEDSANFRDRSLLRIGDPFLDSTSSLPKIIEADHRALESSVSCWETPPTSIGKTCWCSGLDTNRLGGLSTKPQGMVLCVCFSWSHSNSFSAYSTSKKRAIIEYITWLHQYWLLLTPLQKS